MTTVAGTDQNLTAGEPGATEAPAIEAPAVKVLGVRHHGPGSARAVLAALDRLRPEVVLIEGPPEAEKILELAAHPEMEPPVALLAHVVGNPARAAFWPFASFSPEWQAIGWALANDVPVRFIDLPAANLFGFEARRRAEATARRAREQTAGEAEEGDTDPAEPDDPLADTHGPAALDEELPDSAAPDVEVPDAEVPAEPRLGSVTGERTDPIAQLARAAGQDDPERWWEDVMEQRGHVGGAHGSDNSNNFEAADSSVPWGAPGDAFDAINAAMAAVRSVGATRHEEDSEDALDEQRREAHMRKVLRAAEAEFDRVAVVCGAWHGPALLGMLDGPAPTKTSDAKILRAMPKEKVALTWVPWTNSRLAFTSGYGAGVDAPGWYQHLFDHRPRSGDRAGDETIVRWLTTVAQVLRDHDLPISSAHIIEAVRLAQTLATLRNRPLAGLSEVMDATWSVMCDGDERMLDFVTRDAVVAQRLGTVPAEAVSVPLEADLRATAKTLRLKFSASAKAIRLDLRKPNDRAKSALLQRLRLLGIAWGEEEYTSTTGTFAEAWTIAWEPEMSVQLVQASVHGTTVEAAASSQLVATVDSLAGATAAVEKALRAELGAVLPELLRLVDSRAAGDVEVGHVMAAFPSLVRARRYGTVRNTEVGQLDQVTGVLLDRICAGLPAAVGGLGDEAAADLVAAINQVHAAVALTAPENDGTAEAWFATLTRVLARADLNGLLAGRITRLLADAEVIDAPEASRRFGLALSHGATAAQKAAWVEGFLAGSPLLLIHDRSLIGVLDRWVGQLADEEFVEVVPALRRTFGSYERTDRELIFAGATGRGGQASGADTEPNFELAAGVLATVGHLIAQGRKQ